MISRRYRHMIAGCLVLVAGGNADAVAGPASGEGTFTLTDHVKGTPEQICEQIDREPLRLMAHIRDTKQSIADYQAQIERERHACLKQLRLREDYATLLKLEESYKQTYVSAKQRDDQVTKAATADQLLSTRRALDRLERDAVSEDSFITDRAKFLAIEQESLPHQIELLDKANAWRATLVKVGVNSHLMHWPLSVGSEGLLGKVRIKEVWADSILIEFGTIEWEEVTRKGEGFDWVSATIHPATMIVKLDTATVTKGELIQLDRNFKIIDAQENAEFGTVFVSRSSPADIDKLFALIDHAPSLEPSTSREVLDVKK